MVYGFGFKTAKTQCLLDGKIVFYDACSSGNLKEAKEFYKKNFKYIGSGYTYFINDVRNVSEKLHHFFTRV